MENQTTPNSSQNQMGDNASSSIPSPFSGDNTGEKSKGFNLVSAIALSLSAIFILAAVFVYIAVRAKQGQVTKIENQIEEVDSQMNAKSDLAKAVTGIYGQVTNLDEVIGKRTFWTNFFKELSTKNTLYAKFQSFQTVDLSKVQITGQSSSYSSLAYLVKSFEQSNRFSHVNIVSSDKQEGSNAVNFSIEATISPSAFAKQEAIKPVTETSGEQESQSTEESSKETPTEE